MRRPKHDRIYRNPDRVRFFDCVYLYFAGSAAEKLCEATGHHVCDPVWDYRSVIGAFPHGYSGFSAFSFRYFGSFGRRRE